LTFRGAFYSQHRHGATVQLARELGPGRTVATVAVDTGLKYLAGDLFAG
jgi:cysteine synthase